MFTNKSNFIFRIFLATLGLILSFQASAEHWIRIASSESSFYYADKDNLTTANGAYFLIIKRSSKDENNKRSQLFKYKIDCAQGSVAPAEYGSGPLAAVQAASGALSTGAIISLATVGAALLAAKTSPSSSTTTTTK